MNILQHHVGEKAKRNLVTERLQPERISLHRKDGGRRGAFGEEHTRTCHM
jgi:hypothetical protein